MKDEMLRIYLLLPDLFIPVYFCEIWLVAAPQDNDFSYNHYLHIQVSAVL